MTNNSFRAIMISRRDFTKGLAIFGAGAAVFGLDACTNTDQPGQTSSTPTAQPQATQTAVSSQPFPGNVILGRPTANSITSSLLSAAIFEVYAEYGTGSGNYVRQTGHINLQPNQPVELDMSGLSQNTQYYYRLRYRPSGQSDFLAGTEATFHTQRSSGDNFIFTVQADWHHDENTAENIYITTLANALAAKPDFHIDLGDTFMGDKWAKNYTDLAARYADERRLFSPLCTSTPLFLVNGNHEGENGWTINNNANSLPIWASNCRNLYYPNPIPDDFYSLSTVKDTLSGLRRSYYSWSWGNSLFVVLDPYWYTVSAKSPSGWDWTLGKEQHDWLVTTFGKSKATFKFVFCHNLVGGFDMGSNGNGRGGIEAAKFYEWGGLNTDGSWGFDNQRPGWGKPIHQLFVDNKVTIFFHGHDHFYGKQILDGVTYQECAQPGETNNMIHADEYGYKSGEFIGSSGYMRIQVAADRVVADYISTYLPAQETATHKNGEIASSYTLRAIG